jgi:predicted NBD/HSP70 family sugar kinase
MQFSTNEISLLRALRSLESPTRSEIAQLAGFSLVSVTTTLNGLIETGIVERAGKTAQGSGRPSTLYRIAPDIGFSIGVSIESSSFRIVAIDSSMRILDEKAYPLTLSDLPSNHINDIVQQLSQELETLMVSDALAGRRFIALGIAPPGMVDTERGVWLQGLQVSGIAHCALRENLANRFEVCVVVEDKARCLAWLERSRAGGSSADPLVLLYLGEGAGAGIVINGDLYRGMNGLAGEIGHMHVADDGDRCPCGNIGCLEMVVTAPSIMRKFHRRLKEGVISSLQLHSDENLDLSRILKAAGADDRLARSTLYDLGLVVGDACATLIELYNPRTMLLGGAVAVLGEFFKEPIDLRLRQRVMPEILLGVDLRVVPYTDHDEAIGAAIIAEREFWKNLDQQAAHRLTR